MPDQLHFNITESSQVAEARRVITALAQQLGFGETQTGKIAIIVTEAATNLIKHAQGGQILARPLEQTGQAGLEILVLDRGPGLTNIGQALYDGYSTTGSPGTGLGAMVRLSTLFDIHSLPGKGTAVLVQVWKLDKGQVQPNGPSPQLEVGAVYQAKPGQPVSGDSWAVKQVGECGVIMVADGLGHGPEAARASQAAIEVLASSSSSQPMALVEAAHRALFHTRGAALAVIELDPGQQEARFAGVGNIAGVILTLEHSQYLTSFNGIIGHQAHKIKELTYPWLPEALLLLHSDGLTSRWDLSVYPGLINRHPGLIAGVLYRDFCRGSDDVTVLVVKQK